MEETIKRLEAEKVAIEAANASLKVTAEAANAAKDAAEAAAAAAAEGSSVGGGGGMPTAAAEAIAKAVTKAKQAELSEECTYPRGITYPEWPPFDPSVKFNDKDPLFVDGHVRALAWRKVWQAIKEHFESARDEYAHSLFNSIMKIRISTLDKPKTEDAMHLFYDGANGKGNATVNPFDPDKARYINAQHERAAHADRVHRMVVRTFTEFLNMMTIERASRAKHAGELVRWRPVPYSHAEAVREIREAIDAGGGNSAAIPFKDGRLPAHTEADNAHHGAYGIAQRWAEYFQLLGLDSMHIMLVKALESQLAAVLKRVVQTPELKVTVANQASEVHAAVPAKGLDWYGNNDSTTDAPTMGVGGAPISYTFAAPGTAALRMLDNRFDANGPFSAIMLLVKAGRVGADSTSLESSLQAVADYDTEVRLFFTLPNGTLDREEMDQAKGLADVLLAVPVTEIFCSTR